MTFLGFVRPISVALQSRTCDLVEAFKECRNLIKIIKDERNQEKFHYLYDNAAKLLKETYGNHIEPEIPRASSNKRHAHRSNAPATTAEEYYRVNYYYPFLDHVHIL